MNEFDFPELRETRPCGWCYGSGFILERGPGFMVKRPCSSCDGTGSIKNEVQTIELDGKGEKV